MRRYWGVALVIVAAALFAACSSRGPKSTGFGADPHGDSGLSKAKMSQLLNAVQTATASISQGVLVEEGRKLFESTTLSKAGQSCATCHPSGGGVNMAAGIISRTDLAPVTRKGLSRNLFFGTRLAVAERVVSNNLFRYVNDIRI